MWKSVKRLSTVAGAAMLISGSILALPHVVFADDVEDGKKVAEDRKKGNCFGCHDYVGAEMAGNIGPKLENMKARYPDKGALRDRIWDETKFNPNTIMPPFGKYKILSEDEIDKIVEFIYSL